MLSQRAHEAPSATQLPVLAKAALSSGAATLADGLVYQLVLFALPQHYGFVAAFGAVAGAIVNFLINRHYTFSLSTERAWPQALRYAVVSLATFFALRLFLAGSIEGLGMSARVAWLPAKLAAFLLVSYPAQKLWVFSTSKAAAHV
ncbi:MAG TPA: GtrA family protein [Polyangiaceae bacterium]|jgi:putative flippase GtrA|nr:GtrA family protein [Polyangiaceae bacterium]